MLKKEKDSFGDLSDLQNLLLLAPFLLWGAEVVLFKDWMRSEHSSSSLPSLQVFFKLLSIHLMTFIYPAGRLLTPKPSKNASIFLIIAYVLAFILNFAWAVVPEISYQFLIYSQLLTCACFILAVKAFKVINQQAKSEPTKYGESNIKT